MSNLLRNIIRLILFVLLQVFVLNEVPPLHQYIIPYIYFLFILWLPFSISRSGLLLLSFITGLCVDFFTKTPGLHAAACVLIGYIRPFLINLLMPQQGVEFNYREPSVSSLGFSQYATYASVLTLFHHTWLFLIQSFQWGNMLYVLLKIIGSTVVSLLLIIVIEIIFIRKQKFLTNT
ncbi:MAG: rod shape-determining protein MreD [Lacibacter sp.]